MHRSKLQIPKWEVAQLGVRLMEAWRSIWRAYKALNLQFANGQRRKISPFATHLQNQLKGNGSNNILCRKCVALKCSASTGGACAAPATAKIVKLAARLQQMRSSSSTTTTKNNNENNKCNNNEHHKRASALAMKHRHRHRHRMPAVLAL